MEPFLDRADLDIGDKNLEPEGMRHVLPLLMNAITYDL